MPVLGYRGTIPIRDGRLRGIPIILVQRGTAPVVPPHAGLVLEVEMKISVERRRDDFIPIEVKPPAVELIDNVTAWSIDDPRYLHVDRTASTADPRTVVQIPHDMIRTIGIIP